MYGGDPSTSGGTSYTYAPNNTTNANDVDSYRSQPGAIEFFNPAIDTSMISQNGGSRNASNYSSALLSANMKQYTTEQDDNINNLKERILKHPIFPLVTIMYQKCELATSTSRNSSNISENHICSATSYSEDFNEFIKNLNLTETGYKSDPELDSLLVCAVRVFQSQLQELEKVHELCDNFCERYVKTLKSKMPMDLVTEEQRGMTPSNTLQQQSSSSQIQQSQNHSEHQQQQFDISSDLSRRKSTFRDLAPTISLSTNTFCQKKTIDEKKSLRYMERNVDENYENGDIINFYKKSIGENMDSFNNNTYDSTLIEIDKINGNLHNLTQSGERENKLLLQNHGDAEIKKKNAGVIQKAASVYHSCFIPMTSAATLSKPINNCDDHNCFTPTTSVAAMQEPINTCSSLTNTNSTSPRSSISPIGSADYGNTKKKVPKVFSKEAITKFRSWLFHNLTHPYPTEDQKRQLAQDTGLTMLQVNNWFINARRRIVQPMIDQNNRSGRTPNVNVFKNRRRKDSEQTPPLDKQSPELMRSSISYNTENGDGSTLISTNLFNSLPTNSIIESSVDYQAAAVAAASTMFNEAVNNNFSVIPQTSFSSFIPNAANSMINVIYGGATASTTTINTLAQTQSNHLSSWFDASNFLGTTSSMVQSLSSSDLSNAITE